MSDTRCRIRDAGYGMQDVRESLWIPYPESRIPYPEIQHPVSVASQRNISEKYDASLCRRTDRGPIHIKIYTEATWGTFASMDFFVDGAKVTVQKVTSASRQWSRHDVC